ncbi:MAG: MotA/TolQ/ExbB proton channel family protein [Neomegalonema sp.]|nr:MotA/TolQ/ExbB proton channel family protein [Neomegalonema sp.]
MLSALVNEGGPIIWLIGTLAVFALTLTLWKLWRFWVQGVWQGMPEARMLQASEAAPMSARREEAERVAKLELAQMRLGLRGLELIVTTAPLLGLLGTVLGMIEAFQVLQDAGARADPSDLAGGIWEALLTTAAGMAVAIPAGLALGWSESVVEGARLRLEDAAARFFLAEGS